jgi:4-hydroxybenzoate polyprenyltransferase
MAPGRPGALPPLLAACRPRQWTKNLLVFAAPLFAFRFEADVWLPAGEALVAFCLISSAIYLLNDCLDVAADRAHPSKRNRAIAAGLVSVPAALTTAAALAVVSLSFATWVAPALAGVVLLYGLIQVGYCLQFKRMPLLDIFCIASGFLLRAIAGAVAAQVPPSPWFLLTAGLLALFLAIEKRKAELWVAQDRGVITRKVLERYSLPLLLRLESTVATSAFCFCVWPTGVVLDTYGPRACCMMGALFFGIGCALFAYSDATHDFFLPGFAFMGIGGLPVFLLFAVFNAVAIGWCIRTVRGHLTGDAT